MHGEIRPRPTDQGPGLDSGILLLSAKALPGMIEWRCRFANLQSGKCPGDKFSPTALRDESTNPRHHVLCADIAGTHCDGHQRLSMDHQVLLVFLRALLCTAPLTEHRLKTSTARHAAEIQHGHRPQPTRQIVTELQIAISMMQRIPMPSVECCLRRKVPHSSTHNVVNRGMRLSTVKVSKSPRSALQKN